MLLILLYFILRKAVGYADVKLHHTLDVREFLKAENHMDLLAECNEVSKLWNYLLYYHFFNRNLIFKYRNSIKTKFYFQVVLDDEIAKHFLTNEEIKISLKDIKVLGKKELRQILTWRTKLNKYFAKQKELLKQQELVNK